MWCRKCGGKTKVNCTVQGETVERFRKCKKCGYSFATVEAATFDEVWKDHCKAAFKNEKIAHHKNRLPA